MPRWAKIDALFYRLVNLLGCKQHDRLDTKCTADVTGKRDSSCTYIIRHIYNNVEVVITKGKVECFQCSADTFQRLFCCLDSTRAAFGEETFQSFWSVRSVKKVFRHLTPPVKYYVLSYAKFFKCPSTCYTIHKRSSPCVGNSLCHCP